MIDPRIRYANEPGFTYEQSLFQSIFLAIFHQPIESNILLLREARFAVRLRRTAHVSLDRFFCYIFYSLLR